MIDCYNCKEKTKCIAAAEPGSVICAINRLKYGGTHADDAPTVDAVEVVRCKDCKHFHAETVEEQTPYGFTNDIKVYGCMLHGEWVDVFVDDFCSYGERKEK